MDAYRDQYAQVFGGKDKVTLVAISVDPDTALASWARDRGYNWVLASDPGAEVGLKYGSARRRPDGSLLDNRTLYVVAPGGRISHVMAPFREVDPTAYTELAEAVRKASGSR